MLNNKLHKKNILPQRFCAIFQRAVFVRTPTIFFFMTHVVAWLLPASHLCGQRLLDDAQSFAGCKQEQLAALCVEKQLLVRCNAFVSNPDDASMFQTPAVPARLVKQLGLCAVRAHEPAEFCFDDGTQVRCTSVVHLQGLLQRKPLIKLDEAAILASNVTNDKSENVNPDLDVQTFLVRCFVLPDDCDCPLLLLPHALVPRPACWANARVQSLLQGARLAVASACVSVFERAERAAGVQALWLHDNDNDAANARPCSEADFQSAVQCWTSCVDDAPPTVLFDN